MLAGGFFLCGALIAAGRPVHVSLPGIAGALDDAALVGTFRAVDIRLTGQGKGGEERHEKQGRKGKNGMNHKGWLPARGWVAARMARILP